MQYHCNITAISLLHHSADLRVLPKLNQGNDSATDVIDSPSCNTIADEIYVSRTKKLHLLTQVLLHT